MIDNATLVSNGSSTSSALDVLCSCDEASRCVPRVTIVAAHPDDEVIGAGGRMVYLGDVCVVHVTDGAPRDLTDAAVNGFTSREAYARARAAERERALSLARIAPHRIHDIGIVDQEASFAMLALTHALADLFASTRPEIVLTHAYEGGHPDHDATAFAVRGAVQLLRRNERSVPAVVEFAGYHWRGGAMRTGDFIPHPGVPSRRLALGSRERHLKQAMFNCYETQQRVLAAFGLDSECFRLAPAYDFTAPPHEGRLFYEWFDWRVTGGEWRQLAKRALHDIGGAPIPC